jgi:hypothetical protein
LCETLKILKPEKITHFIFERGKFTTKGLQKAEFHRPFNDLVRKMARRDPPQFAFNEIDSNKPQDFVIFSDAKAYLIDLKKLEETLKGCEVVNDG